MIMGLYDSFHQLDALNREMDRFFYKGMSSLLKPSDTGIGFPQMDLHETERAIVATCNLPGIEKKEDIHIDVDSHLLTVSGFVQKSNEIKEEQIHRKERYYGRFERCIMLPARVSGEGVEASYKNGLLEIHIPKQQGETKKSIEVDFKSY
jgi:HSP20 family protein